MPLDSTLTPLLAMAIFGLTGSLHCAAMCGPMAATACGQETRDVVKARRWVAFAQYHLARLIAYTLLGFAGGLVTAVFVMRWVDALGRYLGLLFGATMTIYALRHLYQTLRTRSGTIVGTAPRRGTWWHLSNAAYSRIATLPFPRPVAMGLATGLLPCGFLMAALMQAWMLANPVSSALAMLLFGLSSSPALLAASGVSSLIRRFAPRSAPVFFACLLLLSSLLVLWRAVAPGHVHGA